MVWFRADDRFHASEPVKKIPAELRLAAIGLWTLTGTWSSQFLKDGDVPAHIVLDFGASIELANELVKCGLWKKRRGGFVFRDWEKWQPTRDKVEQKREEQTARVAAWRAKRAGNTGDGNAATKDNEGVGNAPVIASRPDPTRPDPTLNKREGEKRGSRIPDGFAVTPTMTQWAKTNTPTVDIAKATEKFINYWTAKAGAQASKLDWLATWRNWMLNEAERNSTGKARLTPAERARQTIMLATDQQELER